MWKDPEGRPVPGLMAMLRLGFPMFLATTFGVIYTKIDVVMIERMVGGAAAGIYYQGHLAFDTMVLVPGLLGTALFPAMARYGMQTPADAVRMGERATRFMMAAVIPLTMLLTFVAAPVIFWFEKGPRFADSVPVMQIVIWGLPLQAAAVVLNRLLITADREKVFVTIGLGAMLTNIVLNWMWIPEHGYFGASWATIVSLGLSLILHAWFLFRTPYRTPLVKALLGPLLATGLAWAMTVLGIGLVAPRWHINWIGLPLDQGWWPFLVSVLVMAVLLPVVLLGTRVITIADLRLLRELRPASGPTSGPTSGPKV